MLTLVLAVQLGLPPVSAWCAPDGVLNVELGQARLELRDHHPHLSAPRSGASVRPLQSGRLYLSAQPVDRVEYRGRAGDVRRLGIDGSGWRVFDGGGTELRNLRVPAGFRRGVPPLLLGVRERFAWFASPTHLLRVDLAADRRMTSVGALGRRSLEWIFLEAGERARFIDEDRVIECEPSLRCETLGRLDGVAVHVAQTPSGFLYSTASRLSRLEIQSANDAVATLRVEPVWDGETLAVCPSRAGTWVAGARNESLKLVRLQDGAGLEHFGLTELLTRALPAARADAAEAWADALLDTHWPGRGSIAAAFSESKSPTMRKVSALLWGGEKGNPALARLWLLGHDDDLEVRISAVHASATWCRADGKMPCRAVLAAFINDSSDEVSWTARDLLLDEDPWAALEGAPSAYRLEAISHLSARLAHDGAPEIREVLERLSADADPTVRAAAQMAVIRQ